ALFHVSVDHLLQLGGDRGVIGLGRGSENRNGADKRENEDGFGPRHLNRSRPRENAPTPPRRTLAYPQSRLRSARLLGDADIGLGRAPAGWEKRLCVVVADRARNDDVLALLPVYRRRDLVLGGELQRIDHAQDLVEVAARGHGISEQELDLLVGS